MLGSLNVIVGMMIISLSFGKVLIYIQPWMHDLSNINMINFILTRVGVLLIRYIGTSFSSGTIFNPESRKTF